MQGATSPFLNYNRTANRAASFSVTVEPSNNKPIYLIAFLGVACLALGVIAQDKDNSDVIRKLGWGGVAVGIALLLLTCGLACKRTYDECLEQHDPVGRHQHDRNDADSDWASVSSPLYTRL